MKKKNTTRSTIFFLFVGLLLLACNKITYKEAMTAYDNKEYEKAGDMFNVVASSRKGGKKGESKWDSLFTQRLCGLH